MSKQVNIIGGHCTGDHRDGWGMFAPIAKGVTSLVSSAFDETHPKSILIYRTQQIANHKDVAGDFDQLANEYQQTGNPDRLYGAGFWWFEEHLLPIYTRVRNRFPHHENLFFQVTNEINRPEIVFYLDGVVAAAEKHNLNLAFAGDAGGSPDWDLWVDYWVPFFKRHDNGNHIICRHAYSGTQPNAYDHSGPTVYLTNEDGEPSDENTHRPFLEADYLENVAKVRMPIVVSELGWLAGWNNLPPLWLADIKRYVEFAKSYENVVCLCLWNAGRWETAPNILSGQPLVALANLIETEYEIKYFDKDEYYSRFDDSSGQQDPSPIIDISDGEDDTEDDGDLFSWPNYQSIIYLLPQDIDQNDIFTEPDWFEVGADVIKNKRTTVQSHHDALACASAGNSDSYIMYFEDHPDLERLAALLGVQLVRLDRPDIPPVTTKGFFKYWPTQFKVITQGFGENPSYYSQFGLDGHEGIDIKAPHGSKIFTVAGGTVYRVNDSREKYNPLTREGHNYGVHVRIDHGNGYRTVYAHLDQRIVKLGEFVKAGQLIGYADDTGNSFGSHLHMNLEELIDGVWTRIDPTRFLNVDLPIPNAATTVDEPKKNVVDLWSHIIGKVDNNVWNLQSFDAEGNESNETCQIQVHNDKYFQVKNGLWEELWLQEIDGVEYIMRGTDISSGGGEYYVMYDENNEVYGAPWVPRYMAIGETFKRTAHVRKFSRETSRLLWTAKVVDTMTLVDVIDGWDGANGIVLDGVAQLQWNGGESYFYMQGLKGWGRRHYDPHTPQSSRVSEMFGIGNRASPQMEEI